MLACRFWRSLVPPIRTHRRACANAARMQYFRNPIHPAKCGRNWSSFSAMKRESYQLHWRTLLALMMLAGAFQAPAQSTVEMREIITRLDRLEKENQALTEEVRGLRQMLASRESITSQSGAVAAADPVAPPAAEEAAPTEERLSLLQNRIDELAQTKVETSQKFPLRITGMALFNAYVNGRHNNNADNPTVASFGPADSTGAATLRQSTIGILFSGPQAVLGAKVSGSMYMDFFAGSAASLNHLFRIRTAAINFDWSRTKFSVGQDKPLISPRDPESLAQVGVSPLTSAGNPWLWQPQARFEQRFSLGSNSGLRAQAGVFQTSISNATTDPNAYVPPPPGQRVEFSRPGAEGRVEFWRQWGETERIELAGGFHYNANRVGDVSLPSEVYSIDWFVRPVA